MPYLQFTKAMLLKSTYKPIIRSCKEIGNHKFYSSNNKNKIICKINKELDRNLTLLADVRDKTEVLENIVAGLLEKKQLLCRNIKPKF